MGPPSKKSPPGEMKVLSVGLPRTGSASMAEALTTLGYQNVHHTINHVDSHPLWRGLNAACDASFPTLPSYRGHPFSRAEWDSLFGGCEAATDAAGMFAPQLIRAYPDAKVVLVVRDFDAWFRSVDQGLLSPLWGHGPVALCIDVLEPLLGLEGGAAVRKMFLGLFRAGDKEGCRLKAREAYERHRKEVREACGGGGDGGGRLLEYKLGEGWEPLCEFLGVPVPEGEFPWTNEAKMLRDVMVSAVVRRVGMVARKGLPWVKWAGVVGVGAWMGVKLAEELW